MGYRIQYDDVYSKEEIIEPKKRQHTVYVWLAVIFIIGLYVFSSYSDKLQKLLLPGDPAVTKNAITAFSENVRGGMPVGEAFTDFCIEILESSV